MTEKRFPNNPLTLACQPWKEDFTLDKERFADELDSIKAYGRFTIYMGCTAGEGYALSNKMFQENVSFFADQLRGYTEPVMVSIITTSLAETIERVGLELEAKGGLMACLNWWLMAWDMNPAWKGGHGGGEETAGVMGVDPSLVDMSEIGGDLVLKDVSPALKATGFSTVEYKGVSVNILRATDKVTDSGWIGDDHPSTATVEWGQEMLQTCADYIADFIDEFKKVAL